MHLYTSNAGRTMSGTRGAGRGDPAAPSNTSLNARGFPGERNYVVDAGANFVTAVGGEETFGDPVGLHMRVAPKDSFEFGTLEDAQDRVIATYNGNTDNPDEHTYTFVEPLDPVPDIAAGEEWIMLVIGRGALLLADTVVPGPPEPANQFVLPATLKGSDRDTITGTNIRFLTGALAEQTFVASAYDAATLIVTVEPHWTPGEGPAEGDRVAVYGERVDARMLTDGELELINPLHVDGPFAGNHALPGAVNTIYRNTYRGMQVEVVGVPSGNAYQLGYVAEISSYEGRRAALAGYLNLNPNEVVTLVITGGWVSQFAWADDSAHALTQIIVGDGQFGVRHTLQSATASGYGSQGQRMYHRETRDYGLRGFDAEPGVSMESSPVVGAYYRVALVSYTPALTGALRVRFAQNAAAADAQVDIAAGAARLTDRAGWGAGGEAVVTPQVYTPYHIENLDDIAMPVGADGEAVVRYVSAYNTSNTVGYYVKVYDASAADLPTEITPPVAALFVPPAGSATAQLDITVTDGYALRASSHAGTGAAGGPPVATVYVSTART